MILSEYESTEYAVTNFLFYKKIIELKSVNCKISA